MPRGIGASTFSVYLPTFVFSVGEGSVIPVIASLALKLGASLAIAGVAAGAIMLGQLCGDVPAGLVVSRIGERKSMLISATVSLAAIIVCLFAPNWIVLAAGIFVIGLSGATFTIARHAFLTVSVPAERRARALSTLGGVARLGLFVGPGISTLVIVHFGTQAVFFVHATACLLAIVILTVLPDPDADGARSRARRAAPADPAASVRAHMPVLVRLGGSVAILAAVRASKTIMIPLWALYSGVSPSQTTIIASISAGAELILFYASGQIMDRYGRLSSILPCLGGLALGHIGLLFTHSFATLLPVGIFLGLVNGLGSGIQLTLGSDIAPKAAPARVLGAWRLFGDTGSAISPLIVSALIATESLAAASLAIASIGAIGCALLIRYVPRYAAKTTSPPLVSTADGKGSP